MIFLSEMTGLPSFNDQRFVRYRIWPILTSFGPHCTWEQYSPVQASQLPLPSLLLPVCKQWLLPGLLHRISQPEVEDGLTKNIWINSKKFKAISYFCIRGEGLGCSCLTTFLTGIDQSSRVDGRLYIGGHGPDHEK